jgi:hypothetical protein
MRPWGTGCDFPEEDFMKRLALTLTLAVIAVGAAGIAIWACSSDSGGGCKPGNGLAQCKAGETCNAPADCQVGLSCNSTTKKCEQVFVCTADAQCASPTTSGNPACTDASKCICLGGTCQERGCSTDAVCSGGKICVAGQCTDKPAAASLSCVVLTPSSVIRQGQTLTFVAAAKNANGAIVPGQAFIWTSSNTAVAAIDASGVATGGTTTGETNITCLVTGGSATPSPAVVLKNYANLTTGQARAVVTDDKTGQPIAGAKVLFERGGTPVGSSPITTAADGVALLTAAGTGALNVHVFHNDYHYVSVMGTTSVDLLLPLLKKPDDTKAGGFKGTFDLTRVTNASDTVEVGIAGASLTGSFIDLDFMKLLGELLKTHVKIGSLYEGDLRLASGLYLKLGDQAIKTNYQALGQPGLRHAWGLGGKVPFDKLIQVLTPIIGSGGISLENLPLGQLIAQVLPFFDKFKHFVKTDITVTEAAKIQDTQDLNGDGSTTDLIPNFADGTAFPAVNAVVNQALTLATSVTIPTLPKYNNQWLEGVILLAGANAAGRGLVPLGVSAAVDAPKQGEAPDGQVDVDPNTAGNQNTVSLKLAPLHDGLEGSKFFLAALSLSVKFSSSALPNISGIITQMDSIGSTTTLAASGFLGFPETAAYALGTRTFNLGTAVTGASFYRVDFKGADGDWYVYFKGPSSGAAFTLPTVPSGATQRDQTTCVPADGGAPQTCTVLRVFTLATKAPTAGGTAPTLDDLVTFGTVNLTRLNDVVSAFSNAQCQPSGSCAPPP